MEKYVDASVKYCPKGVSADGRHYLQTTEVCSILLTASDRETSVKATIFKTLDPETPYGHALVGLSCTNWASKGYSRDHVMELFEIYVDEEWRGRGAARTLLTAATLAFSDFFFTPQAICVSVESYMPSMAVRCYKSVFCKYFNYALTRTQSSYYTVDETSDCITDQSDLIKVYSVEEYEQRRDEQRSKWTGSLFFEMAPEFECYS